ncbi:MAG: hypothetical protein IJL70_09385 [Treponema sp.]|nr:hypothetical protein [Treponema sp.]
MKKVFVLVSLSFILFSCSDIGLGDTIGNLDTIYINQAVAQEQTSDSRSAVESMVTTYAESFEEIGTLISELSNAAAFTDEEYEEKLKALAAALETIEKLQKAMNGIETSDGKKLSDMLAFNDVSKKIEQIKKAIENGTSSSTAKEELAKILKEIAGTSSETEGITTLSEAVEKIKEQIEGTKSDLKKLLDDKTVAELGENATVSEIIAKIEEKIENKELELETAKTSLTELLTDDQKNSLSGNETISDIIEKVKEELNAKQEEINAKETELSSAKTALTELLPDEQKETLSGSETVAEIIEKIEDELKTQKNEIEAKKAEIASLNAQIEAAGLNDDEKTAKIAELTGEISSLESENATAKETLKSLLNDSSSVTDEMTASEVAELVKNQLKATEAELSAKTTELAEKTEELAEKTTEITNIQNELNNTKNTISDTKTSLSEILTALDSTADTSSMTLEQIITVISEKTVALQTENNSLSSEKESTITELSEILKKINENTYGNSSSMSLADMIAAIKTEVESLQEQIESGQLAYSELQKQLTIKKGEDTKNLYKGTCLEGVNLDYFGQSAIVVDVSASGFFICISATEGSTLFAVFDTSDWTSNTKSFTIYEGTSKSTDVTVDKTQGYREMHNIVRGQTYRIETSDGSAIKIKALVDGYENIAKVQ